MTCKMRKALNPCTAGVVASEPPSDVTQDTGVQGNCAGSVGKGYVR